MRRGCREPGVVLWDGRVGEKASLPGRQRHAIKIAAMTERSMTMSLGKTPRGRLERELRSEVGIASHR